MKRTAFFFALFVMAAATSAFAADPAQTLVPADKLAVQMEQMAQQGDDAVELDGGGWGGGHIPRPNPHPYPRPYPHPFPRPYPYPYYTAPYYPAPYYGYPGYQQGVVCYAQNSVGNTFTAYGVTAPDTQEQALSFCWNSGSQNCVATGCSLN